MPQRPPRATRRLVAGAVVAVSSLLALAAVSSGPGADSSAVTTVAAGPERPNIVLIMTDDQALEDLAWMRRTRRLIGDRGVTFSNAVSPNPLCCPARASLITGQNSHNNGVWTNTGVHGGYGRLTAGERLPEWLQDAGYRTALIGKYLNGYAPQRHGSDPGWNRFDPSIDGTTYRYTDYTMYRNGRPRSFRGYITDYVAGASVRAINAFERADARPFFLWSSYVAPHAAGSFRFAKNPVTGCWTSPIPARRHRDLFPAARPPSISKPSFREDLSDKNPDLRLKQVPVQRVTASFRARIRSLAAVDEAVARTVRALREAGELGRTLIVFTSDNGFELGEHGWTGKLVPYEESLRVPLLVRGPGVASGATAPQLATTVDLTRTFVDLAGATATRELDGISLTAYLADPAAPDAHPVTIVQTGGGWTRAFPPADWMYRGYRDRRYTLVRFHGGFAELYDRRRDPYQLTNRARRRPYAEVYRELVRRAERLEDCSGAACRPRFGPLPAPGRLPSGG